MEVAKAEKKRAFAQMGLDKLKDGMSAADYATKKPENVREKEAIKASSPFFNLPPEFQRCD